MKNDLLSCDQNFGHATGFPKNESRFVLYDQKLCRTTNFFLVRVNIPGANPTIASYNTSVVKIYSTN
jgi:hypothetical protein